MHFQSIKQSKSITYEEKKESFLRKRKKINVVFVVVLPFRGFFFFPQPPLPKK